jgi:hypothetical protein
MEDGSVVDQQFPGEYVGLRVLFEFCQGEGYDGLLPEVFENGLPTHARKGACEVWCRGWSWIFLQQDPVDTYSELFQVLKKLEELIEAATDTKSPLHAHQKVFGVSRDDLKTHRMDLEIMCEALAGGLCLCTADKRFYRRFSPYLRAICKVISRG